MASFPRLTCFASGAPPHSRVVAAHGEQEAAEQPHVGVEPGGRHLPYMVHDAHGGGEAKRRRRRRQDSKMAPLRRVLAPRAAMTPAATPPRWGCLTHACQKKIQKNSRFFQREKRYRSADLLSSSRTYIYQCTVFIVSIIWEGFTTGTELDSLQTGDRYLLSMRGREPTSFATGRPQHYSAKPFTLYICR